MFNSNSKVENISKKIADHVGAWCLLEMMKLNKETDTRIFRETFFGMLKIIEVIYGDEKAESIKHWTFKNMEKQLATTNRSREFDDDFKSLATLKFIEILSK